MTKPIQGTWFEFEHHTPVEGKYWDPDCARFTAADWDNKIQEMAGIGMEYLVLMSVACFGQAYYRTGLQPFRKLGCNDPLEALLAAGDKYGLKIFMSNGFWGTDLATSMGPAAVRLSLACMTELWTRYGRHKSFYGWYFPNEACVDPYFAAENVQYVKQCIAEAHRLSPRAKTLIAPYGTNKLKADDTYVRQLEEMGMDIVAYQDEVGVRKSTPEQTPAYYQALRAAHYKVPKVALWADVEVFEFEGDMYKSALVPAKFERVKKQLESVSPFVDTVLIYQYQGMLNQPGSKAYAGHRESTTLYAGYVDWLKTDHPQMMSKHQTPSKEYL